MLFNAGTGFGTLRVIRHKASYTGMLRNGKPHGDGVVEGGMSRFNGTFVDGNQRGIWHGSVTLPNGIAFEGDVQYSKDLNGQKIFDPSETTVSDQKPILNGTFTLTNGSQIIDDLADGKFNGEEKPILENGDRVVGSPP